MAILKEVNIIAQRIYAIGDIHGCLHELSALLDYLENTEKIGGKDIVVFVGDYIDRGPDSFGVISRLVAFKEKFPNTLFLRGNHEDMLLELLGFDGSRSEVYLKYGGLQCLASYKLLQQDIIGQNDELQQNIRMSFPADHLDFLLDLESYALVEDYVFAHAGLNLSRPLKDQSGADLFWIREPFLSGSHQYGKTIIFGHTNFEDIKTDLPGKIGIDTGLVYGNKLSCLELKEKKVLFIPLKGSRVSSKGL